MNRLMIVKLCLPILFCIGFFSNTQAQGIQFEKGNWESILAKAKKENKLVFIDAFTVWCGPCKKMARDVFPVEEVGSFYNSKFVNAKIDMEKGEGLKIASKYKVTAYPTLLFVNGDGELVHKGLGYHEANKFLELGTAAVDPTRQLVSLETMYNEGDRSETLLLNYTKASHDAGSKGYGKIADEYLETQDNWKSKDNMEFILSFVNDVESKPYKYLLNNRSAFEGEFGKKVVDGRIANMINSEIFRGSGEALSLDRIDALYKEGLPEYADRLSAKFRVTYYERAGDGDKFAEAAINYLENFPTENWQEYNAYAWTFYENFDNEDWIQKAIGWAEKSISMNSNYYNTDTAAALYYKAGNKKMAKKYAKTAIKLAKAEGESFEETTELFNKIKKM